MEPSRKESRRMAPTATAIAALAAIAAVATTARGQVSKDWAIHDESRPMARKVDPGLPGTPDKPGTPPADAVVLFDGKDLSKWRSDKDASAAKWKVADGYMEVAAGTGDIRTEQAFGDCQLHVEWRAPSPPMGKGGQDQGNSGVFLMGRYEVQVLDTYDNKTYADGQAAAIYGQYPPLVNAARPPGQWQAYDIVFRAPRFDAAGKVQKPAILTVFHNGVLVQDHRELTGPTAHKARPPYEAHADKLPLKLQDHSHPVRFRNVWIRELEPEP
jgi:hypothetical protein